ncbi:MAG: Flp1 family type IVb pilin [Lachnospiraceae bacterium]|nr:Flp1 family type IVb pilin [Lachnospiraceae bacterium]
MNTLRVKEFLTGEDGVGVVEMILIIVVLIGLVILFRDNLTKLVKNIFNKINTQSDTV